VLTGGAPPRLRPLTPSPPQGRLPAQPAASSRGRATASISHVRGWLAAVFISTALFTILFSMLEGWSPFDSLYMTVITFTTVGYREVHELHGVGRLVTMAASVVGVVLIFGGVGIMSEFVLAEIASGRRERRQMQDRIAALQGHFIVCGYGRVGSTVARELAASGREPWL